MNRWIAKIVTVVAMGGLALAGSLTGASAGSAHSSSSTTGAPVLVYDGQVIGTAQYSTNGSASPSHTANTIPYWTSSFTWNGTSYPYQMVGANPSSNQSTTVTTWIIPINFVLADGNSFNGASDVQNVLSSPIYQNNPWNTFEKTRLGSSQYGDSVMRVEFNKTSTNYHVLLKNGQTLPTQTIAVPSNQAIDYGPLAIMSASWFSAQEQNLMNSLHVPSTVVPIFLTNSVFLYEGNPGNCCVLGWHGASSSLNGNGKQQVQSYIYAAYTTQSFFCSDASCNTLLPIEDIHALSHEVSEWLNDPFVDNVVPDWSVPFEPQYGCSNLLEAGDPLVGFSPNTNLTRGWHPQDIPLAPWFMRQTNADGSINPGSLDNTYTYPDTAATLAAEGATGFNTYSPGC